MSVATTARALLVLGRVSNLPTVLSNCLAAWWLGGAQPRGRLGFLLAGATLVYLGGMFLNDACDVEFDRKYRRERPIPSGVISAKAVWGIGIGLLLVGEALLFGAGVLTGALGLLLIAAVVCYDAAHKRIFYAPVLMGLCRFCLYLVAGATAADRLSIPVLWGAAAMFLYIVGLSYIARRESDSGVIGFWPVVPLIAPIVIALGRGASGRIENVALVSIVVALWVGKSVRYTLNFPDRNVGRAVSGLLAGICLVDWLAVANAPREFAVVFIGLFLLALGLQRWVPAT